MSVPASRLSPEVADGALDVPVRTQRLNTYLLVALLPPLFCLAAGFFIIPSRWFAVHSGNTYLATMGYSDTLQNADCQVLIYGDSSAMVGLDPQIIRQETGLSACNIAEFQGQTIVSGTLSVDHFLAHNPRPRYLVFAFAPEDYDPVVTEWSRVHVTEAITYRLQHERNWSTVALFARHIPAVLSWDENGLHYVLNYIRQPALPEAALRARDVHHGWLPHVAPTLTACLPTRLEPVDEQWMNALRQKYGQQGTRVLLDAVPVPECDAAYDYYKKYGLTKYDNEVVRYPLDNFTSDGRLHMNDVGSKRFSQSVAEQIQALERQRP